MQPKRYVRKETHPRKPIGKCALCGGVVSIPTSEHSAGRPVAQCEDCHATASESAPLSVVPMKPKK